MRVISYFKDLDRHSKGRLKSIDFLRGIAAFAVLLHHAVLYSDYQKVDSSWFYWLTTIINQGHLGVPLFFVISGYCIHAKSAVLLAKGEAVRVKFGAFWKRRMTRLYPNYIVVLIGSMLLVYVAYLMGQKPALVTMYPEPKPWWMLKDFFAHVFMLHGFHPVFDQGGGNPPMWTLAREEYLYLMYFPLLFLRKFMRMSYCTIAVAAFGIAFYGLNSFYLGHDHTYWPVIRNSAIVLWAQWVVGALAVELRNGLEKVPTFLESLWTAVPLFALALIANRYSSGLGALMWALVFFVVVTSCTKLELENRWPSNKFFTFFTRTGVFSYSLYLVHSPVIGATKQLLGPLKTTTNTWLYTLSVAILVMISFLASLLLFAVVESKFLHKKTA